MDMAGNRETANVVQSFAKTAQEELIATNFTPERVPRVFSLVETLKFALDKLTGNDTWLPNSGASYHMTGIEILLHDVRSIESIPVELDGTQTSATKKEIVPLSSKLILRNVLYCPNLRCISIT